MLAAILSAIVRPTIDTCPGFGFDAPIQGSGKTLLAKGVNAIATGRKAAVTPHVSGRDDEEIRKRVMSLLTSGSECVVWDNIMGIFNSAALAGLLTSTEYSDRILGSTATATIPNAALWLFTGNNLQMSGDMPRRIFRCRIDPEMDDPYGREFDFDPENFCLERRKDLVNAGITVIKAWFNEGKPHFTGKTASFEQWDELVRQPIAWLSNHRPDLICDPMDVMRAGQAVDPEQAEWGEMLDALHEKFQMKPFTTKDILRSIELVKEDRSGKTTSYDVVTHEDEVIYDSVSDGIGLRDLNGRRLGRYFMNRADRIVNGMRLVKGEKGRNGTSWMIRKSPRKECDFESHAKSQKSFSNSQKCEKDENDDYVF